MTKLLFIWCLTGLFLLNNASGQRQVVKARPRAKAPVAKPFSLERIIVRLQDVANKEYAEAALIKKIEKDGIDFTATAEKVSHLKDAGASESLLNLVRRLGPAPAVIALPPPAPKVDPTGSIDVTCAPAECLISLNDGPAAPTRGAQLVRKGLAPGDVSVRVSKDGFIPWSNTVNVVPNKTISVRTVLNPNLETRALWGAKTRDKVIQSLGGAEILKETRSLLLFGEVIVWGHDGKKYSSSLEMLLRDPGKAFFRTRSGKRSTLEVEFLPTYRSKSNLAEAEVRDLEAGFRLLLKYQMPAVIDRLCEPGAQIDSETEEVRDGTELRSKSSTGETLIVLNADGRPKELEEKLPFGEGVHVLYSAYKGEAKSYYPTQISIIWPGSPKQGIAIEIRKVEVNPEIKIDTNYSLKKVRRLFPRS